MSAVEAPTSVPFSGAAKLSLSRRINPESGRVKASTCVIRGVAHPEPYDLPTAVAVALADLAPLTEQGWCVNALDVRIHGEGVASL